MADPRVGTVAKILVDYSVGVQPNQLVWITGGSEGAPLILAVYQKVLERQFQPIERTTTTISTQPVPAVS